MGGALLLLLGGGSQALAASCEPPADGVTAAAQRIESAATPRGLETTEVYGHGVYRVSRCAADGRFADGMTVGPIRDHVGRAVLVPLSISTPTRTTSALYADGRDWSSDHGIADRRVLPPTNDVDIELPATIPAAPPEPATAPALPSALLLTPAPAFGFAAGAGLASTSRAGSITGVASADDSCTNAQFARLGLERWPQRSYSYRINSATFGNNDQTTLALVYGHRVWDLTYNDCGFGDQNNIESTWALTTARSSTHADGISTVDKGEVYDLGCGDFADDPRVIACTLNFRAGGKIVETDQRYDNDAPFTNTGASDAYDYWAVSAHESGHSLGLDHVGSSRNLTMFPEMIPGDLRQRTLARGDVLGLRAIYPAT
jgi:Matrixin